METELPLTVTTSSGFFDFAHLIGIAFVRNPSGKVKPARKPAWILQKAMCSNPVAPILLRQGSNAVRPPARQRLLSREAFPTVIFAFEPKDRENHSI